MEVDLTFRGVDLLALFQECRFRLLLNLVTSLPRNTHTGEAMSQDDELVAMITAGRAPAAEASRAIRMAEFSPEVEALYGVTDRLGDVVSGLVGLGGRKPPRISPLPRPSTAWERFAHRQDLERHQALVRRVLPNG